MNANRLTWLAVGIFALNAAGCGNNTESTGLPITERNSGSTVSQADPGRTTDLPSEGSDVSQQSVVDVQSSTASLVSDERQSSSDQADPIESKTIMIPEPADSFLRHDGVYRSKRKTTLIDLPNADVYSYLAFTRDGTVYWINGDYIPGQHYLEQPQADGSFLMKTVSLADQPEFIFRSWIGNKQESPPTHAQFGNTSGKLQFRLLEFDNYSQTFIEVDYAGEIAGEGIRLSWRADVPNAKTFEAEYQFVAIPSGESSTSGVIVP